MYPPPICSSPTDGRTDSFSPSILPSSRNLFILGDFNCHHPLWDSRGTSDPAGRKYSTGSFLLTSSPSMTLTHLLFSIAPLAVAPPLTSLLPPPFLLFPAPGEVLQDLGSDHLPILLSIPLSPVFRPNEHPPSFKFQKARWDGFASYFDSHCPSAEEYSSLSLSSAAALFTSLT